MEQEEKYSELWEEFNGIIKKYYEELKELIAQKEKLYAEGKNYESKEVQKIISTLRKKYMQEEEEFYNFLVKITNFFNKEKIIIEKLKDLRREAQFHYCQCFIERSKIENEAIFSNTSKIDIAIKKQYQKLEENTEKINTYDKRILEMMGIFLSIFSIIGLGTSSILNIENNHFAIWSMICGVILITMSGLFYMINYKDESTMNKRMMLPVIIGILLFCIGTVAIIKYPTENKTVKDFEARLKILEEKNSDLIKKLDYEKRINELEKKAK